MDYKHKIEPVYHEDPDPDLNIRELYAVEAADKVLNILNWVLCSGDRRSNITARAATLGYILGQYTEEEAAQVGRTSDRVIRRLKGDFCKTFGIRKQNQNGVIRRNEE